MERSPFYDMSAPLPLNVVGAIRHIARESRAKLAETAAQKQERRAAYSALHDRIKEILAAKPSPTKDEPFRLWDYVTIPNGEGEGWVKLGATRGRTFPYQTYSIAWLDEEHRRRQVDGFDEVIVCTPTEADIQYVRDIDDSPSLTEVRRRQTLSTEAARHLIQTLGMGIKLE